MSWQSIRVKRVYGLISSNLYYAHIREEDFLVKKACLLSNKERKKEEEEEEEDDDEDWVLFLFRQKSPHSLIKCKFWAGLVGGGKKLNHKQKKKKKLLLMMNQSNGVLKEFWVCVMNQANGPHVVFRQTLVGWN